MLIPYLVICLVGILLVTLFFNFRLSFKNKFMAVGNYRGKRVMNLYSGKKAELQSRLGMVLSLLGLFLLFVVIAPYFFIHPVLHISLVIIVIVIGYLSGMMSYNKNYKKYREMMRDSQEEMIVSYLS